MHQIGETGKITLESKTFEVELHPHHQWGSYEECEKDCPEGWQIPTYFLLQTMRNIPEIRDQFRLLNTLEYAQNPDAISREHGYVARFNADSDGAFLNCGWVPTYRDVRLGVRPARKKL